MPSITSAPSYYRNQFRKYIDADPGVLVILARHGATQANDAKMPLVRGWYDVPLDSKGKLEAQLLGNKMKKYQPSKIVSSDFLRDQETANIVASIVITNNIETDYNLRTWDVGNFSGKPLADVNPAIEQLYKEPWRKPPGSDESFNDFSHRFISTLDMYLKTASINIYRPLMLIAHGKNIALAKTYIDGGNAWESQMPKPAGYAVISVGNDRTLSIDIHGASEPVIEDI